MAEEFFSLAPDSLQRSLEGAQLQGAISQSTLPEDPAVNNTAEAVRNGTIDQDQDGEFDSERAAKRLKLDQSNPDALPVSTIGGEEGGAAAEADTPKVDSREKVKGVAQVKPE